MRFSLPTTRRALALGLSLCLTAGTAAADELTVDPAAAAQTRGDRSGARLAQNTCLQCHGMGVGPDLRLQKLDYETLHHVTRHGLNAMPAFRESEISDDELRAVAAYIASLRVAPGATPGVVPGSIAEREGH
ncbi:c-type cytochrome [Pseudodonghicola flavimaris]|uniref:C-type cytochrome n=1 Tax=Pseudodonghicola flavimaris TaxID=3050036 RepID=A0ABT7F5D9_9RHOB|nr:c-type cytochrome [Pseudodonghicola flavimaris]MDK3019828.1 c-type cytochrome [Pseudodonghicola flavimaris]